MRKARKKQGSATLDRAAIRRMVMDNTPMQTALGIVRLFPGEQSHFEIQIDSETGQREVMVDVELLPRSERVLCRLGFGNDTVYRIPRVDQEVAVLVPFERNALVSDELDGNPIIVAILDTMVPDALDDDDVVVINSPRVIVLANTIQLGENAVPLATLADVQALRDTFNNHGHLYTPGPGAAIATPAPVAPTGVASTLAAAPSGTDKVTGE